MCFIFLRLCFSFLYKAARFFQQKRILFITYFGHWFFFSSSNECLICKAQIERAMQAQHLSWFVAISIYNMIFLPCANLHEFAYDRKILCKPVQVSCRLNIIIHFPSFLTNRLIMIFWKTIISYLLLHMNSFKKKILPC